MATRRLGTLVRADLGKHIEFRSENGKHVSGTIRTFTHGIYSRPALGEKDVPMCMLIIREHPIRVDSSHWASPDTKATVEVSQVAGPADE